MHRSPPLVVFAIIESCIIAPRQILVIIGQTLREFDGVSILQLGGSSAAWVTSHPDNV